MGDFSATIVNDARGTILQVVGRLDFETIREFERTVEQVAASQAMLVVVDASQLGFLNSAGVGALIKLHRGLRERNAEVRLAGAPAEVLRMLKVCCLDQVFKMTDTVEQGLVG